MSRPADPMETVREFYRAVNRGEAMAVAALYAPDCIVEYTFLDDGTVYETREVLLRKWTDELASFSGALPGGDRVQVTRIAGIETGWGWVRSEWVSGLVARAAGEPRFFAGYSDFLVEGGLIRRQRTIRKNDDGRRSPENGKTTPDVVFPRRPVVGVGAVVLMPDGKVVLVKRRNEPLAGQWSLPGGGLELGESLEAGAAREVLEETGLVVEVGPIVEVFDRILLADDGRVRFHFVLVDYLCWPRGGTLQAGTDVEAVTLAEPDGLAGLRVTEKAQAVVQRALELQRHS